MLIAHVSDTHLLVGGKRLAGRFDTGAAFDRLIASLARQPVRPDLILFSGDLGEDATDAEYRKIGAGLRSLGVPVRAVPGNHDLRAPMRAALAEMTDETGDGHLCLVDTSFPLAVIGLDTIVEGAPHGELCARRLAWLDNALKRCGGRPTIVFQHHPPIVTGLADMDSMGLLAGREEEARLIAAHGAVEAVLCGHIHRAIQGRCGGAPVRVAPSASHAIAFDLRPAEPYRFTDEPAQYMLHLWRPGDGLVSHAVAVAAS